MENDETLDANYAIKLTDNQSQFYAVRQPRFTALSSRIGPGEGAPKIYRRTFVFGMVIGWPISAVACLFGYDADVWLWDDANGFRFAKFTKWTEE